MFINNITIVTLPLILSIISIFWSLFIYHVTNAYLSKSTFCSCLNVKELVAWNRRDIWSLNNCNGIWTHKHLVHKRTLPFNLNDWVFVYKLSGCELESRCSHYHLFSNIFNSFRAKVTWREGLQLCFFYKHFLLKFGAMEVRMNISLYRYMFTSIAYLWCVCEHVFVWNGICFKFHCSGFYFLFYLRITYII